MDILDFFSGDLPWGKFHRLLLRLPWYSDYKRALEDDAEFWRDHYSHITDPEELSAVPGERPSLTGWDEYRELAAELKDQIAQQTISLLSPHIPKGKPKPKFKPVPRPKPARIRALEAREQELDDALQEEYMGMVDMTDVED